MTKMRNLIVAVATLGLLATACGSSDTGSASTQTPASSQNETTTEVSEVPTVAPTTTVSTNATTPPTTTAQTTAPSASAAATTAAPSTAAPSTAPATTAADARCTLSAEAKPVIELMGNTKVEVLVDDTGSEPCDLPDAFDVYSVPAEGSPTQLQVTHAEQTWFGAPTPSVGSIAPGDTAAFYLTSSVDCEKPLAPSCTATTKEHELEVKLANGATARFSTTFDTSGDLYVSGFGQPDPPAPPDTSNPPEAPNNPYDN